MKTTAAVLYETGKPLQVEELSVPPLKPGQLLVEIAFSGVCHSQLMEVQGNRGVDRYLPHLLGHEGSGIVIDVGPGVEKVKKGDVVVLTWIKSNGMEAGGSQYTNGDISVNAGAVTTFGTTMIISENRCVKLPEGVPLNVGALFGCAVLTGSGIVFNTIKPQPHNSLLVIGTGGIGLSAIMAAKVIQCQTIIAVDVVESKLELAKEFGATHVINANTQSVVDTVRELTNSLGVDFAVESSGRTRNIELSFDLIRKNGLSVFASHPPAGEMIQIDPFQLISGKRILGSWGGDSKPDQDIPLLADLYLKGQLPLDKLITHTYPLYQINEALSDLGKGQVGRALIEF